MASTRKNKSSRPAVSAAKREQYSDEYNKDAVIIAQRYVFGKGVGKKV